MRFQNTLINSMLCAHALCQKNMRTILFILRKEFRQLFRDKVMSRIIFMLPIMQLLVLSYAATFEIKRIDLYLVDLDKSVSSRELISKFQGSPIFTIVDQSTSYELGEAKLKSGKAHQIIQIPNGFERDLNNRSFAKLQVVTDAIDGNTALLMNAYAVSIILDYNKELIVEEMPLMKNTDLIDIHKSFWYNPELNYITYMVPGILALLITIIGMFLTAGNVVREKETGTIEQINVTPIKRYHFITGKLLPFWIISVFELAFGLTLAWFTFNIPILGSLWLIFLVASVYILVVLGFGLIISTVSNTQPQSMFIAWFFLMIFILMSGLFTPVDSMPEWAQIVNYTNPIAYFIKVMRMVMLKGSGFADISNEFYSLLVYAVVALSVAVWRYKKTA